MVMDKFKIRKLNGVTEIQLRDSLALRDEFCRVMGRYAPLLSEMEGTEPTFDTLKGTREAIAFLASEAAAGRRLDTILRVCGVKGSVVEKEVLFFHEDGGLAARSSWKKDGGIEFVKPN